MVVENRTPFFQLWLPASACMSWLVPPTVTCT